jgi:hypothetical protein
MPRRLDPAVKAQREAAKAAAKAQREAAKAASKAQREAAKAAAKNEREAAKLAKKIATAAFKKHVKKPISKKKLDTVNLLMENASNALSNDLLRRVYMECMRLKNDDNRLALTNELKTSILEFSKIKYIDESMTREFDFPGLGRVRMDVDAYKGTRTKKALVITAGNNTESVVYGAIFFNHASGMWTASAVSFGSTAGASLAFESLREFMDDVAKDVVEAYNESRKQTFDRRYMNPEFVRAKVSEIGLEAAAAHFGISVYRLNRIIEV